MTVESMTELPGSFHTLASVKVRKSRVVEYVELRDHPWFVATQAHPELKSRPTRPAPLFRELVGASLARAEGRAPKLFEASMVAATSR